MRQFLTTAFLVSAMAGSGCSGADEPLGPESVPEFGANGRSLVVAGSAADGLAVPRDLAFHPDRPGELWTVNRQTDGTVIYFDAGLATQSSQEIVDSHAGHFMDKVSGLAFGAANTFASCQESRNSPANDFMGPALWSADLAIYGQPGEGPLGSHLDMLHQSPLCMGIAHDAANAYWVFDGKNGHVVYYDFAADHGPGHDDHSDGIVRRYTEVALTRLPDVIGDMALDPDTGILYVADTGAGRVVWMDTATGAKTDDLPEQFEPLAEFSEWTGVEHGVFADGFDAPSGLAIGNGRLFVADHATGAITAFDLGSGDAVGRLETAAEGIQGLTLSPDGKLWFVDATRNELVRIDAL